jgi:hypothetical protein
MLSRRLKGKWSLRRRQGFHSTLLVSFTLRHHSTSLSNWYNLPLVFTCTNGGESKKGSQSLHFWRLMPKGESISPKQKDRTTTFLKFLVDIFQIGMMIFNWYILKISISIYFQLISIKTLLKTKRRISFRGSFV